MSNFMESVKRDARLYMRTDGHDELIGAYRN